MAETWKWAAQRDLAFPSILIPWMSLNKSLGILKKEDIFTKFTKVKCRKYIFCVDFLSTLVFCLLLLKCFYTTSFTKMAMIHVLFEQIQKFQCLKLSTNQGLSTGTLWLHMACMLWTQMCLPNSSNKTWIMAILVKEGV